MTRDDSLTLTDVRGPTLATVCAPWGRRGSYRLGRLMAEHGGCAECHAMKDACPNVQ
jgi:hypothetical protein